MSTPSDKTNGPKKKRISLDTSDAKLILGFAFAVAGIALIWYPLAFIVGGAALVYSAIQDERHKNG